MYGVICLASVCAAGCQKSDSYRLMEESKDKVLPIYEEDVLKAEDSALASLEDVYKQEYVCEEWRCGADERQLCREIFLEILFLNGFGTVLGLLAGWALTCYTDLGIMIGYIDVRGDVRTCLLGGMVCAVITVVVSFLIFRKLKNREIAGLLNGH